MCVDRRPAVYILLISLLPGVGIVGCGSTRRLLGEPQGAAACLAERSSVKLPTQPSSTVASQPTGWADSREDRVSPFQLTAFPASQPNESALSLTNEAEQFSGDSPYYSEDRNSESSLTLEYFESLALAHNPTLRGLAAITQKAAGYRTQVGLRPNPRAGYQGDQLAAQGTDQHTAFIEQEFVTANKLELNRRVQNEALRAQLLELETQRVRVLTDVRIKFYEALNAQQRMELISDFQSVTDKGLELAELRKQALEGSQVDVLQSKIQKYEIDLALRQAQVDYWSAWQELVALSGARNLPTTTLRGDLPHQAEPLDWTRVASSLLAASPELEVAQARISQARVNLQRQGVQAVPNVTLQLGAGVDTGIDSGLINMQIGAPLPVFNQNQGNLAAARADYCRAVMDAERIKFATKARLAVVSREYDSALAALNTYGDQILPSASDTLSLAELAYRAGETSFIQVLVARRTYFDSNLQYIAAQTQLARARAQVDGFVLTGGLEPMVDLSGDDSLREQAFSQQ